MYATLTKLNDSGYCRIWTRLSLIALLSVFGALFVSPAAAAGRVIWKKTTIEEHTKKEAWYLELEVHLPRAPDVGQKGMKFEFTQISEFERSLVDGKEEPQLMTTPLSNQQALIESQLVGFMDPGSGVIQNRTHFSFKVTRAHGYRAGQYKVKIKDSDNGSAIGVETTLTFKGENPVVDRRSIVFTGTPKKKDEATSDSSSSGKTITDLNAPDEPEPASSPSRSEEGPAPEAQGEAPPSVDERPGGGCHYGAHDQGSWAWAMLVGLLGLVLVVRKRAD